jgi:hypothetical protein
MGDAEFPSVFIGFAKEDKRNTDNEFLDDPLDSFEPCEFHFPGLVKNMGY